MGHHLVDGKQEVHGSGVRRETSLELWTLRLQAKTELPWCSPATASLLERSGAFGGYACLVYKHHYLVQECYIYHKPKQAGPPDG